jgi:hypothetical protein
VLFADNSDPVSNCKSIMSNYLFRFLLTSLVDDIQSSFIVKLLHEQINET